MTDLLSVIDVSVRFGGLHAVDNVSLAAAKGSVTAVIGPNGAGKSTLLNVVSGFLVPNAGRVLLNGTRISGLRPWQLVHRGVARTFQELEVFQALSVGENVALGIPTPVGGSLLGPILRWRRYARERRSLLNETLRHLDTVGLAGRADESAGSLSYADQKLLIIARLLATGCELLLFDEPGAGLSREAIDSVGDILRHLAAAGRTVLLVDHNMRLVFGFSDYVYVLHHGRLVAEGTAAQVQSHEEVLRIYLVGAGDDV